MKTSLRNRLLPYCFIAPTFILLSIFSYIAIGSSFASSFTNSKFGYEASFIGLQNYAQAFRDPMFIKSFTNQAILTLFTVLNSVIFPILAAELIFFIRHAKAANIVKTAFVIPMLVPQIVTILIWKYLYNPNFGFNSILDLIGLNSLRHNWLNDEITALISVILVGFPFVSGMYFLIFHSALNTLGAETYEAAIVDGASAWNVVWRIHLPNVKPFIKVVVTLSLIGSLSGFGLIAATTGGGPGYATMIPAMQMYKVAFGDGKFGYASALGVVLFAVIIVLTLLFRKLVSTEED